MKINKLYKQLPPWLMPMDGDGNIILSSFLGLSRNIEGFLFTTKLSKEEKARLTKFIKEKILHELSTYQYKAISLEDLTDDEKSVLEERQLIPSKIKNCTNLDLLINQNETSSILINHHDHIRMKTVKSGLGLTQLWETLNHLDDELSQFFPFSYDKEFGFLTSHTSNVGTGLFCEVLMHLPAFVFTGKINNKINELLDDNILIKHFFTYSELPLGNLYLISNRQSIGMTEIELIDQVENCVKKLSLEEKSLREKVLESNKSDITDKTYRSLGILTNSYSMPLLEALALLSILKFGFDQKIIQHIPSNLWNELLIYCLPGHLQLKNDVAENKLDIIRSQYLKSAINKFDNKN
ncbi:MAG: hypothetical protein COA79_10655 [Planctomycetota bacterium]|nr:MAG: hypothetical protein COA79_10655 [Planctomycetota bacterium]